jgi:hypothetical protein
LSGQIIKNLGEISVAKITIFRPDGKQSFEKVEVTSVENGVVQFSIPRGTNEFDAQSVTTNLPFLIEGD